MQRRRNRFSRNPWLEAAPQAALVPAGWRAAVRPGSYWIRLTPVGAPVAFVGGAREELSGVLRVAEELLPIAANRVRVSGDLYQGELDARGMGAALGGRRGTPIFSRVRTHSHLRLRRLGAVVAGRFLQMEFVQYRWFGNGFVEEPRKWVMRVRPVGSAGGAEWMGEAWVGGQRWEARMGYASSHLRSATVALMGEVFWGAESPAPREVFGWTAGGSRWSWDWRRVFARAGWDVGVRVLEWPWALGRVRTWTSGEVTELVESAGAIPDGDREWSPLVVVVRELVDAYERGVMPDLESTVNSEAREFAIVSSHWTPEDSVEWGGLAGRAFWEMPALFFRTAVHECGHVLGLDHVEDRRTLMATTPSIELSELERLADGRKDPDENYRFDLESLRWLQHGPDILVRPGGASVPFEGFEEEGADEEEGVLTNRAL